MYIKNKIILDRVMAFLLILLLFPLLLFISMLLFISTKQSPFFFQKRPGKDGELFALYKFKTMNDLKDEKGQLLPDELRLTFIGGIIRKLSLDELPQFFNVIRGDMSFIGPRPLLEEYLPLYSDYQKRRHDVRPGITGWAQVNGRNLLSWEERFKLDVWYVDNISFLLDCKIFLLTLFKIFIREGINPDGKRVVMRKFKGND